MSKPNLQLAVDHEPTRQEIAMAQIDQSWREYRGENGREWSPYVGSTEPWSHKVSDALATQYRVVVDSSVPWPRRLIRWLSRIL
jgi:hypothetical protein